MAPLKSRNKFTLRHEHLTASMWWARYTKANRVSLTLEAQVKTTQGHAVAESVKIGTGFEFGLSLQRNP